ncbi:MAG: hypothetical protein VB778_01530 [Nitrospinaceae bacterium]
MSAAPDFRASEYHQATTPANDCMECHIQAVDKIPIMPHRPMGTCTLCHDLTDKPYY